MLPQQPGKRGFTLLHAFACEINLGRGCVERIAGICQISASCATISQLSAQPAPTSETDEQSNEGSNDCGLHITPSRPRSRARTVRALHPGA